MSLRIESVHNDISSGCRASTTSSPLPGVPSRNIMVLSCRAVLSSLSTEVSVVSRVMAKLSLCLRFRAWCASYNASHQTLISLPGEAELKNRSTDETTQTLPQRITATCDEACESQSENHRLCFPLPERLCLTNTPSTLPSLRKAKNTP